MIIKNRDERGFMLLSAVFLTLTVSVAALILMNARAKVQQRDSTLYLTAINLANEQFAILESDADVKIPAEDLTSIEGVKFEVKPEREADKAIVTVKWTFQNRPYDITLEKIISTGKELVNE